MINYYVLSTVNFVNAGTLATIGQLQDCGSEHSAEVSTNRRNSAVTK